MASWYQTHRLRIIDRYGRKNWGGQRSTLLQCFIPVFARTDWGNLWGIRRRQSVSQPTFEPITPEYMAEALLNSSANNKFQIWIIHNEITTFWFKKKENHPSRTFAFPGRSKGWKRVVCSQSHRGQTRTEHCWYAVRCGKTNKQNVCEHKWTISIVMDKQYASSSVSVPMNEWIIDFRPVVWTHYLNSTVYM